MSLSKFKILEQTPSIYQLSIIYHLTIFSPSTGGFDYFIVGDGRWQATYKAVECPSIPGTAGNIMFRFQGSNPWYLKLQVRNSK